MKPESLAQMERQNAHIAMPGNILPKPVYVAIASLVITEIPPIKETSALSAKPEQHQFSCVSLRSSQDRTECTSCALGNGVSSISALSPTDRLEDNNAIRMRDNDDNSPTFDSEGVVRGRVEVMKYDQLGKPPRKFRNSNPSNNSNSKHGSLRLSLATLAAGWATVNSLVWDDGDALITCRQIGTDLGYITVSGEALEPSDTPAGSGETGVPPGHSEYPALSSL